MIFQFIDDSCIYVVNAWYDNYYLYSRLDDKKSNLHPIAMQYSAQIPIIILGFPDVSKSKSN